jgi:hypothetical protein
MVLSLLTKTSFDIKKYANLPEDVVVVQKYGSFYYENNNLFSSCGILYINDSRIFYCVVSKGLSKENASQTIGKTVNRIHNYVIKARNLNYIF